MSSLLFGLAMLAALIIFGLLYESEALFLFAVLLVLLMITSYIFIFHYRSRLFIKLDAPVLLAEKGKSFFIHLSTNNHSALSLPKTKIKIKYLTPDGRINSTWLSTTSFNADRNELVYELMLLAEGSYDFTLTRIRIYDLFGLFFWNYKKNSGFTAMVLPELKLINVAVGNRLKNFFGDADTYDDLSPGKDPSDSPYVREYRAGDKLQRIHWKLSAKQDDLVVRELSNPKACAVILFLNNADKKSDDILSQVAGIAFSMLEAGCRFYACWWSKDQGTMIRARVEDEEGFFTFLTTWIVDRGQAKKEEMLEIYAQRFRGEAYLHTIYIEKSGELLYDEETIKFKSLDELELTIE